MMMYVIFRATSGFEVVEKKRRASALRWYFQQGVPIRQVYRKVVWHR